MTEALAGRGWSIQADQGTTIVVLNGDWIAREATRDEPDAVKKILDDAGDHPIAFEAGQLGARTVPCWFSFWPFGGKPNAEGSGSDSTACRRRGVAASTLDPRNGSGAGGGAGSGHPGQPGRPLGGRWVRRDRGLPGDRRRHGSVARCGGIARPRQERCGGRSPAMRA